MYSFDSLTLKYFFIENKDFIDGSIVQKIQLPSRSEIILTMRNIKESQNKKLYININPKYPHVCFADEKSLLARNIEIPSKPPMFCMQLRKYLNGSKIKDFKYVEYDRILEFYFDYFDEIGSLIRVCLAIEFMGKYSNIILYNSQNKAIIGTAHNVSQDKSSVRELYGGIKYTYPPLRQKLDILNISYATFFEIIKDRDIKKTADNFYYLNQTLLKKVFLEIQEEEKIYSFLQSLVSLKNPKYIADFWGGDNINNAIDSYFSNVIFDELMKNKKNKLKKLVLSQNKKYEKILLEAPDNHKAEEYKKEADYIMANLYNPNIRLPYTNLTPSENAQKLYKLYKKSHIAFEHSVLRINEAKEKLKYFEEVLFNIENSSDFIELSEIEFELGIQNKKANSIPKIKKIEYKGFEIYIGKNNRQNDYLISKIASREDLWFHGLNYPSAHIILKVPNNKQQPSKDVIEYCAKLTKENSKARNGGKTSIIMTKRKNLKKPPNTYPGYVTYKNEIEIVI